MGTKLSRAGGSSSRGAVAVIPLTPAWEHCPPSACPVPAQCPPAPSFAPLAPGEQGQVWWGMWHPGVGCIHWESSANEEET